MERLGFLPDNQSKTLNSLLDIVYPPVCIGCGAGGFWCCETCFQSIDFHVEPPAIASVDRVMVLGSYAHPVLRKLLTNYKYRSATCLEPVLSRLLSKWKIQCNIQLTSDLIVPAPTSQQHILERGFDHAERLAHAVGDVFHIQRIECRLKRNRKTYANAALEDEILRKGNISGAMEIIGQVPDSVLLIDDVITTGATIGECAKVLKRAGVSKIEMIALAFGG